MEKEKKYFTCYNEMKNLLKKIADKYFDFGALLSGLIMLSFGLTIIGVIIWKL
jgi:hypothetical protein